MVKETVKSMSQQERKSFLEDNADHFNPGEVFRHYLSDDEKTDAKDDYMKQSIEFAILEEQKKQAMAEFKEKMDRIQQLRVTTLGMVRTGSVEKVGTLFFFPDHELGMMEVLDEEGHQVEYRRLRPDEKQTSIHNLKVSNG